MPKIYMPKMWLGDLWYRIGQNGLPPLAKDIIADGVPIARIVDVSDYKDNWEHKPKKRYIVEDMEGNQVCDGETFSDPYVALGYFSMCDMWR